MVHPFTQPAILGSVPSKCRPLGAPSPVQAPPLEAEPPCSAKKIGLFERYLQKKTVSIELREQRRSQAYRPY